MGRIYNYGTILLIIAGMALFAGCKQPEIANTIVPGLTLPRGAKEAPLSAVASELYQEQKKAAAEDRMTQGTIMIGFNYDGDIEAVAQHVEKSLKPLGWKRLKPFYIPGRIGGVVQKVYWSPNKCEQLQLTDWLQQNMQAGDYEGKARFTILVIQTDLIDPSGKDVVHEGGEQMLDPL